MKSMFKLNKDPFDTTKPHYAGWNYVLDNIIDLSSNDSNITLDTYTDNTFQDPKFVYNTNWIGIIHHPFNTTFSNNNSTTLFYNLNFLKSLKFCKGLIVLSKSLQTELIATLRRLHKNTHVYHICHPTLKPKILFNYNQFLYNNEKGIYHIGSWMRNSYAFYELDVSEGYPLVINAICKTVGSYQKIALKSNTLYFENHSTEISLTENSNSSHNSSHNSSYNASHSENGHKVTWANPLTDKFNNLKDTVKVIKEKLSNDEYDLILSKNIVFLNLIDASAINTLIECVVRNTPIIINKLPAVVEILGESYPMYYTFNGNYNNMNRQIQNLLNNKKCIYNTTKYLYKLDKSKFTIEIFKINLKEIILKCV